MNQWQGYENASTLILIVLEFPPLIKFSSLTQTYILDHWCVKYIPYYMQTHSNEQTTKGSHVITYFLSCNNMKNQYSHNRKFLSFIDCKHKNSLSNCANRDSEFEFYHHSFSFNVIDHRKKITHASYEKACWSLEDVINYPFRWDDHAIYILRIWYWSNQRY